MKKTTVIMLIALVGIGAWVWLGSKKGEARPLTEILGKAKGITSFKYDVVVTPPRQAKERAKVWHKGKRMRVEGTSEGRSVVYLLDVGKQLAYLYIPAQNIAMKMDFGKAQESVGGSPVEKSESVVEYNPVVVGSEVRDGKDCLVIEYTTEREEVKMWIWKKHGFPIRTESTTAQGTSVTELKNIEFVAIPDSMFKLPAGVQIMEIPGFGLLGF